jgi:Flp pilus assembly protein TadD
MIRSDEGQAQSFAGNDERAIALLRQTVELDPKFSLARIYFGLAALGGGDFSTAIAEAEQAKALEKGDPNAIVLFGNACARAGRAEDARRALGQLEELARTQYVDSFAFAFLHVGMGQKEKALDALEKAYEERSPRLVFLKVMRAFEPLRSERRFQSLVSRLRIPAR